jgi:hypothetical protein
MNSPDIELEIKRDGNGRVVGFAYKTSAEAGSKKAIECNELSIEAIEAIFKSEGPEDHSTLVVVDFSLGNLV